MSYNVRLCNKAGEALPTDHFLEGGTRNIYGAVECDLNITGNYWQIWRLIDFNPRDLDEQTARDTLPDLQKAATALGAGLAHPPKAYPDYWAPTPGNALVVVDRLRAFAEKHPDGTWEVAG